MSNLELLFKGLQNEICLETKKERKCHFSEKYKMPLLTLKQTLASLLRQCKILATRLGSAEFGAWVDNELSGYKSVDDLPDYRIFQVSSKGDFFGRYKQLRNADIPLSRIPENYRESISHCYLRESVASIEALVEESAEGLISVPWNSDFVASVSAEIYQDMRCMEAWKVLSRTSLIAILDEIRNRILSFVLEIEAENPEAGEAEINSEPVPSEKVTQIFNTYM